MYRLRGDFTFCFKRSGMGRFERSHLHVAALGLSGRVFPDSYGNKFGREVHAAVVCKEGDSAAGFRNMERGTEIEPEVVPRNPHDFPV